MAWTVKLLVCEGKVWQLCPISLTNCQAHQWRQNNSYIWPVVGHFSNSIQLHFRPIGSNILLIFPLVIFQSVSFPEAFLEKNCYDVNLKALIRVTAHWQVDTFYAGQFYLIKHWCLLIYFSEVLYDLLLRLEGKANLSSSSFSFSVSIWQLFEIKHFLYWLPFPY